LRKKGYKILGKNVYKFVSRKKMNCAKFKSKKLQLVVGDKNDYRFSEVKNFSTKQNFKAIFVILNFLGQFFLQILGTLASLLVN
jgi:hypothetical protein